MHTNNDSESAEAIREYKERMVSIAIDHLNQVDVRTVTVLHKNNLFERQDAPENLKDTLAILSDPKHPSRISVPEGPLLFHKASGEKAVNLVVNVADLLFSQDSKMRKAALIYFEQMEEDEPPLITPKTRIVIEKQKNDIETNDPVKWRTSALALSDCIKDDWLCNLAAVRQCLAMNFHKGGEQYLTPVMRPSVSSADSISLGVWAPSEQKKEIEEAISKCVTEASNLQEALDNHYRMFGHLPLGGGLSITRLIEQWEKRKKKAEDAWELIWMWADKKDSPLPRYHACQIFVNKPELIPKGSMAKLWEEIAEVIHIPRNEDSDLRWTQAWRIRCELAGHFYHHLESRLPGADSERIAAQAWWLAEQMAMIFGSSSETLRHVRKETILPEVEISSNVWGLARPFIKPSDLRCATMLVRSVWSLSLQCQIGANMKSLGPKEMRSEDWGRIGVAISGGIVQTFPLRPKEGDSEIYAFDRTVIPTAQAWSDFEEDNKSKEMVKAFIAAVVKVTEEEEFGRVLKELAEANEGDKMLIGTTLRSMAYGNTVPLDLVWECIADEEWREALLLNAKSFIVELFFDSLAEIQIRNGDKWAFQMPHFFAAACEAARENAEQRGLLFSLTVLSSMSTDSASAIERLCRGPHRSHFTEYVTTWRERIKGIWHVCPPGVKARLRATLASLTPV